MLWWRPLGYSAPGYHVVRRRGARLGAAQGSARSGPNSDYGACAARNNLRSAFPPLPALGQVNVHAERRLPPSPSSQPSRCPQDFQGRGTARPRGFSRHALTEALAS